MRRLGAHYHTGSIAEACDEPDAIIECTGVSSLVLDAMEHVGPGGVVCLTGVSAAGRAIEVDEGALNRSMVLANESVVGSVNANRRHYEDGGRRPGQGRPGLARQGGEPEGPPRPGAEALERQPDDVKVVLDVGV